MDSEIVVNKIIRNVLRLRINTIAHFAHSITKYRIECRAFAGACGTDKQDIDRAK